MMRSRYNVNPLCDAGQAGPPKAALRMGDYKLLSWCYSIAGVGGGATTGPIMCPQNDTSCDPEFKKGPVLYNLKDDISESNNIAESNPLLVAKMLARLKELAVQSVEPQQWTMPYQGEAYFCKGCPLHPNGTGPASPWAPWCEDNEVSGQPCKAVSDGQRGRVGPFPDQQDAHLTHDARVEQ